MPGITDLEENIARLERASADAREATREAREATKDLKRVRREIEALLVTEAQEQVDAAIAPMVKKGLDELGAGFEKASRDVYARVQSQADVLLNLTMGRPHRDGDLRPALAAKFREWIDEQMRAARG